MLLRICSSKSLLIGLLLWRQPSKLEDFSQDEGIHREYQRTVEAMREESKTTLEQVKKQAEESIAEAKRLAQEIEQRARRTAAHISVEEDQEQFEQAHKALNKDVHRWAWLSGAAVVAFILFAIFLFNFQLPTDSTGQAIYYAAIRITALTALAAVSAFCLRVLRAHMHMRQHNLHRQRLANSMPAFVESAITPEQRDLILAQLIDAVASFGTSGLLPRGEDSMTPSKLAIESITRTLVPPGPRT